ncbi:MAG: STAS domain-containing protein [Planctomycetota bacterium]|jgi:anti-anti-sigma factor
MSPEGPRLELLVKHGVTVAKFLDAKLLEEASIREIGEQLKALVGQADPLKLVLDFSSVTHMSSSALGALITVHKKVQEKNGQLRLACIHPSIYEVFVITRLKEIFHIHSSVEDALTSLS